MMRLSAQERGGSQWAQESKGQGAEDRERSQQIRLINSPPLPGGSGRQAQRRSGPLQQSVFLGVWIRQAYWVRAPHSYQKPRRKSPLHWSARSPVLEHPKQLCLASLTTEKLPCHLQCTAEPEPACTASLLQKQAAAGPGTKR